MTCFFLQSLKINRKGKGKDGIREEKGKRVDKCRNEIQRRKGFSVLGMGWDVMDQQPSRKAQGTRHKPL